MSDHTTPGQLRLTTIELRQMKWMLGNLLALVSLWTLIYIDAQAELLLAATTLTVIISLIRPGWTGKIPRWVWNVAVPIILTISIFVDFWLSMPDLIPPLVRMLLLLVLVRSLQQRRRREDLQLLLMCLFMVMLTGVLTLSMSFGFQILLFTPIGLALLFLITLTEPVNQPYIPLGMEYRWDLFQWRPFIQRIRMVQDVRVVGMIGGLFIGVLGVSFLIFIIMPRFQINQAIPFLNLSTTRSLSGFSDRIAFGDVVDVQLDERVALRVDVPDRSRIPVSPYWRMVVLDKYSDGVFEMSGESEVTRLRTNTYRVPRMQRAGNEEREIWTFYLEGGISKYLPVVGRLHHLRFQERRRFEHLRSLHVFNTTRISGKVLFYQAEGAVNMDVLPAFTTDRLLNGLGPIHTSKEGASAGTATSYPFTTLMVPGEAQNLEVLDQIVDEIMHGKSMTPQAFSAAVVAYLQQRHRYSLQVNIPGGDQDLMVRWLASDEPGHCELFAGAFTLIARQAGYPTRIVTGFRGGVWNGYEQYYMVRNKNAHAWCEVYDGKNGWFRVDATPGNDALELTASVNSSLLNIDLTWGAYFDSLRILWYRRIVKFDQAQQRELAARFGEVSAGLIQSLRGTIREGLSNSRQWFTDFGSGSIWTVLLKVALVGGAILGILKMSPYLWQQIKRLRNGSMNNLDPIRQKAGQWLARMNYRKTEGGVVGPVPIDGWQDVLSDLRRIRYGRLADWPEPSSVFRQAREVLKRARG